MDERTAQIAAHHLMEIYGKDALSRIAECIEDALVHGQGELHSLWCRVHSVVTAWQAGMATAPLH